MWRSKAWRGAVNTEAPIDVVAFVLQLGASFVARSFSRKKAQLAPFVKALSEPLHSPTLVQQQSGIDQELRLCPRP
jgi:hypothetical protein